MSRKRWSAWLVLGMFASVPALRAQSTLTVNGQPGQAPVIQVNGRSYVDLEALARLLNGSLGFQGKQISLSLPAEGGSTPATASPGPPANSEFSREFLKAGIEEMTVIREWRSALLGAVKNNYPVTEEWMASYQGQAAANLRLAYVAASTGSDRGAWQLLSNVFEKMSRMSKQVVEARKNMEYLAPDALQNDPLNQQILTCARSLASMAAAGVFQDDGSCH
jgi:hypothetical protein